MATVWIVQLPLGIVSLLLPFTTMVLSFRVFHSSPKSFRHIHHGFVGTSFLLSLFFVIRFLFYSGEQGAISAFLLLYAVGFGYLAFIALFSLLLTLHIRMRSS